MSITRGEFLKSLKKSLPGMVLGGGTVAVAQKILGKVAAAAGTPLESKIPATLPQPASAPPPKAEFIDRGPTGGNRIALTFDDGPTPGVTDRILDELKRRDLRSTFFMIGQRIAASSDLARRVLAEGHEIGNHTFTHPNLTKLSDQQAIDEIQKTQDVMHEVLHHRPIFFRPPYGAFRQNQAPLAARCGLRIVNGSVDSRDWAQPGESEIVRKIFAETDAGTIIICHDVHAQTANCIGEILDGLVEKGFVLGPLFEFLS